MNTKSFFVAAALSSVALFASASEASDGPVGASLKSRAEVHAEVLAARQSGSLVDYSEGISTASAQEPGLRSRAEVRAEAVTAARTLRATDSLYYIGG